MALVLDLRAPNLRGVGRADRQQIVLDRRLYRQQRAKDSAHRVAVRALAFKWICILHHYCKWICILHHYWLCHTLYDDSRYLMALQRRGSPLLAGLVSPDR